MGLRNKYTLGSYLNSMIFCLKTFLMVEVSQGLIQKALVGAPNDDQGNKRLDLEKFAKFTQQC